LIDIFFAYFYFEYSFFCVLSFFWKALLSHFSVSSTRNGRSLHEMFFHQWGSFHSTHRAQVYGGGREVPAKDLADRSIFSCFSVSQSVRFSCFLKYIVFCVASKVNYCFFLQVKIIVFLLFFFIKSKVIFHFASSVN
jgi:hypothetical protein